ncbi:hypothetical protein [Mariprofundus ferrooxydans]|nr:hypothetical protein [Mariprofundus ferrooxydans]
MNENKAKFTVGELKSYLADLPDETQLVFEHGLTFYRITTRGENLEQLEFKERFLVLDNEPLLIHADDK